jgi:DNA-binding XRE family transcriptional regulator
MNLKAIREKLRISQDELGKLARVRRVHILSHEKGYRKLNSAEMSRVIQSCVRESGKLAAAAAAVTRLCSIQAKTKPQAKRKAA